MEISTFKIVISMFGIWLLYKLASVLFRIVGTHRCDCCGKDLIPLVEKNIVVCDKCINNHTE